MSSTAFRFKKYIDEIGFYCTVDLETYLEGTALEIILAETVDDPYWNTAIEFGIKYFYEHYRIRNRGLKVVVNNIHTMTADSSYMVVSYAVVKCLSESLSYGEELIRFNETDGKFIMTK